MARFQWRALTRLALGSRPQETRSRLWRRSQVNCTAPGSSRCSRAVATALGPNRVHRSYRSEEHTSELQSHSDLVCRLLLEKKKINDKHHHNVDTSRITHRFT